MAKKLRKGLGMWNGHVPREETRMASVYEKMLDLTITLSPGDAVIKKAMKTNTTKDQRPWNPHNPSKWLEHPMAMVVRARARSS